MRTGMNDGHPMDSTHSAEGMVSFSDTAMTADSRNAPLRIFDSPNLPTPQVRFAEERLSSVALMRIKASTRFHVTVINAGDSDDCREDLPLPAGSRMNVHEYWLPHQWQIAARASIAGAE